MKMKNGQSKSLLFMLVPVVGLLAAGYYLREDNRVPEGPPKFLKASGLYSAFPLPSSAPPGIPQPLGAPPSGNYETQINAIIQYGEPKFFMHSTRKPNWQIKGVDIVDGKGFSLRLKCVEVVDNKQFSLRQTVRFQSPGHVEDQKYTLFCIVPLSNIPRNKGQVVLKAVVVADGRWTLPIAVQLRDKDGADVFTKSVVDGLNEE